MDVIPIRPRKLTQRVRRRPRIPYQMTIHRTLTIAVATFCFACTAFAEEKAPSLPLSKAAKIAEDAIAAASLPADCFVRSVLLMDNAYYQVKYRPTPALPDEGESVKIDIIKVTMDGKASFEQIDQQARRRIRVSR